MEHNVILPRDLALYMAQFMPTAADFIEWIIIVGLERDHMTGKPKISSQLSDLVNQWKERLVYIARSKLKRYFCVTKRQNVEGYIEEEFEIDVDDPYDITYLDEIYIDKISEAFDPLLPFLPTHKSIYYVRDGNNHINGRFSAETKYGETEIVGRFKDSKIVGDVFVRKIGGETLYLISLDDPYLYDISGDDIIARSKTYVPITDEQKKEVEILSQDLGSSIIFYD